MKKIVVIHIHYVETSDYLLKLANLVDPDLLLITYTDAVDISKINVQLFKETKTFKVENRGRDIYPLIFLSELGFFQETSLVWKFHSKASLHLLRGHKWLHSLCEPIAGSKEHVERICEILGDSSNAMVGSFNNLRTVRETTLDEHQNLFSKWDNKLNCSRIDSNTRYFAGTIFACRSQVLDRLRYLALDRNEFIIEELERKFSRLFAYKLIFFNILTRFGMMAKQRDHLDLLTRPASQTTYAMESYIGHLAELIGKVQAV
jgi:lipopolysaccharide biosynthesis protein